MKQRDMFQMKSKLKPQGEKKKKKLMKWDVIYLMKLKIVIKMLTKFRRTMDEQSENFNKETI